jgi:uncharacterized protein (DUF427 family)
MEAKRHYCEIDICNRKLTLKYKDTTIAETTRALILKEVGSSVYDPVFYLLKDDLKIKLELEPERRSRCPLKGDATYWNVAGNLTDNYFAWSYEDPLPDAEKIRGYIAFNMEYITFISEPI